MSRYTICTPSPSSARGTPFDVATSDPRPIPKRRRGPDPEPSFVEPDVFPADDDEDTEVLPEPLEPLELKSADEISEYLWDQVEYAQQLAECYDALHCTPKKDGLIGVPAPVLERKQAHWQSVLPPRNPSDEERRGVMEMMRTTIKEREADRKASKRKSPPSSAPKSEDEEKKKKERAEKAKATREKNKAAKEAAFAAEVEKAVAKKVAETSPAAPPPVSD